MYLGVVLNHLVKLATVRAAARSGASRDVRMAAGLSLREVAEAIGVGVSTIHRWEAGDRRPHGAAALRYADLISELKAAALASREEEALRAVRSP